MIKKLLLFTLALTTLSCSSESEDVQERSDIDPIIGTWSLEKLTEYPTNAPEIVSYPNDCEARTTVTFKPDGTYNTITYDKIDGECVIYEDEDILSSSWERVNEGKYRFSEEYDNNGEVHFSSVTPKAVSFPDNNTMTFTYEGTNRPSSDPIHVEYYVNTFTRR
ncbi:lipocalin family protein [Zunongwangia sp. F260]|uniref:Lipocalin family protein n=1 Tax=Autumnicola lenta TaxID=3075593 RepID=A0ABU3CIY6_9FLAO|nr:lipocalin family protein [Zunongwangia sp. F260]MDT0646325.1 lipocalin family protein [Zunongwangia sp. F260]